MPSRTSPATYRNRDHILEVLKDHEVYKGKLLEIGSGTGEHGLFFAQKLPALKWVTSDVKTNHVFIKEHMDTCDLKNLLGPEVLKVGVDDFPRGKFDYVFTANTLHIMSWKECKSLFKLFGKRLREGSLVFIYGPFKYDQKFTSPSNEQFDINLKESNPNSGIRSFEDVCSNMTKAGLELVQDHDMPANNRVLVFRRVAYISKR